MTIRSTSFFAGLLLLSFMTARAQEKIPVKFGKVTPEDFNVTVTGPDSAAGAVVIADYGVTTFETTPRGWFEIVFKHTRRLKIIKQSAFDAATVTIPLYISGNDQEKLLSLHAATYTLENGKVVETKLDDKSVFTDKLSRKWMQKKFTFPALKEGAILEYSYTQSSPFLFFMQPWSFQGGYPCLWSEYQADIPNFFEYVTMAKGDVPFAINTKDSRSVNFQLTIPGGAERDDHESFEDNVVTHRWVMKNVPALKEEPFTTTISNYIARLEFQLRAYNFTSFHYYKDVMGNWFLLSEGLLAEDDFGADLDKSNGWMDDDMKTILEGTKSDQEKAQRIYAFVRDKFNCTSHNSLYLSDPLKTVYKNRHGSEAEINLLLVAMLRHARLAADPVILSTRDNGFATEIYPLLDQYNYVVCRAQFDSLQGYLDASEPWLGFGKLPLRCYNGFGRVLNKGVPSLVPLTADNMTEGKVTLAVISNPEKGTGMTGRITTLPGFNETCELREKLRTTSKDDFLKTLGKAYTSEYTLTGMEIDSLNRPDDPLEMDYDFTLRPDSSSDLFYFNPMLAEGYKENPFKSAERKYPVEMPYTMDETYNLTMDIPEGYTVDEIPKSVRVKFNDTEGYFEYLVVKGTDNIQLRSRIKLNKANFKPEDYDTLRDFFGYIVKKQGEQIVFKKKKTA